MTKSTFRRNIGITIFTLISIILSNLIISTSLADPSEDFSLKWTCDTGLSAYIGPVSKDIDGDGIHEIFIAGKIDGGSGGRVMSIDWLNISWPLTGIAAAAVVVASVLAGILVIKKPKPSA